MSTTRAPRERTVRGLTPAGIAAAALRSVDEDGLAGLTMRGIAARLGCAVSSLYSHVGGREDVLDLVVDHLAEQVVVPTGDQAGWREGVEDVCGQLFSILTDHADIAGATLGTIPTGTAALRVADYLVGRFRLAGLDPVTALNAADLVQRHTAMAAYEAGVWTQRLNGSDQRWMESRRRALEDMPAESLPQLWPLRHRMMPVALADREPARRFRFGLSMILDGIAGGADPAPGHRPRSE